MPQPASRVKWNGNYFFGNVSLLAKPNHAAMVAAVIAGWSVIEAHLGRVFAIIVSSKHPVTMEMYGAARSFEVQRDLLRAAARVTLPKTHYAVFDDAIVAIGKGSVDRNRFAHGVWGHSADPDLDALLLVEPDRLWDLTRRRLRHRRSNQWKPQETNPPANYFLNMPHLSRDDIMVWHLSDLQDAYERTERAYALADALFDLCADQGAQRRRQILHWLRSQPEIQRVADKRTRKNPQ